MLLTVFYFGALTIGIEALLNQNLTETLTWTNERQYAYLFNIIVVYSLFLIFLGIFNRFFISFALTNVLVLFLAVMSYFKFNFLGENLYPWDLLLYNNVINLLPNLYQQVNLTSLLIGVFAVIGIVAAIVAFLVIKKPTSVLKTNIWSRLSFIIIGAVILSAFTFYRSVPATEPLFRADTTGVFNQPWDQNRSYKENGFMVSFLFNMQSAIVFPPPGYSKKNVEEIILRMQEERSTLEASSNEKPNIIIVMNEAFWDPTLLETIDYTPDPIPNVRENQAGWMLSPTFGGGTSNVEFEVLTGLTNSFLPTGSVPYQQYLKNPMPVLPSFLSDQGYRTIAMHPYPRWFWNREEVYNNIGFHEFIDIDGFENPVYKGPYVGDMQISNSIIEETEASEDPAFIFAVTMQNHTSYSPTRYEEYDVAFEGNLTEDMNGILRTYTQGAADADDAFARLTAYYSDSDEPTMIIMFGDHLPTLGLEYEIYKQTGYLPEGAGEENWTLEDRRKMKETPLAFWNNYGAAIPEIGAVSASYIAPLALDMAGIEKPLFYDLLEQFYTDMPGYTREVKIDKDDNLYRVTPDEFEKLKSDYQILQYDLLFGDQYGIELYK